VNFKALTWTVFALLLTACAGPQLKKEIIRDPPSYAIPVAQSGPLAELSRAIQADSGADHSGFILLDGSADGLNWRLALMDSAVSSLDIQTYLWYPDNSGRLILERAIRASERGVHVRLLVDDLLTAGRDQLIRELDLRPNIEVRLFNPWEDRSTLSRAGEMIAEMERLNTRMHDKLMIADGHAAVVGGRNIGDHYFGLSEAYNFHDLDLLGFGHIATQANGMFDSFWNSEWVVSAQNLDVEPDPEFVKETWAKIQKNNREAPALQGFPLEVKDWTGELAAVRSRLRLGTSHIEYDEATGDAVKQNMAEAMFPFLQSAKRELLLTNAYIIPGQPAIDQVKQLTNRGVKVRILTNSLESHDVPAVNSHYEPWRDDFLNAGAELYELRADAAIQSRVDVPPAAGEFVGLHTKAVVIDREKVFIGSMNLDPRSASINTEAGAVVFSPELAEDLAQIMERDMGPENAWQVLMDDEGELYWINSDTRVEEQPARDGSQRAMNEIFKIFPKEQY
jgi:putative cardiolipin synthase